jgi:SAM-dependent methyltransferase
MGGSVRAGVGPLLYSALVSGIHDRARQGFGRAGAVAAYERGRPGYPEEAVAELVRRLRVAPGATVLDLAAGTGKLTRQLLATGADLVAVEPVAAMRERLARALAPRPGKAPGGPAWVRVVGGTAEAIPLRDGSLDAVTVGQAFHWFDGPRAVAELHRILRPGGRLGLIWNVRDESRPAVAAITAILDRHAGDAPRYRDGRWRAAFDAGDGFTPLAERTFHHLHRLERAAVLDRFASISFIAALPDADRARVLAEIDQVIAAEPSLAGQDRIGLPYRTDLYWCTRRDDAE